MASVAVVSCASSPSLTNLKEESITRRPTLPEGVSVWRPILARSIDRDPGTFAYPFQWEQGYTGRFTLVWMPLPLQAKYMFHAGEGQSAWVEAAFLGSLYARDRNFDWRPSGLVGWKRVMNGFYALDAAIFYNAEISRSAKNNFSRSIGARIGAQTQPFHSFSAGLSLLFVNEQGRTLARYLGAVPSSNLVNMSAGAGGRRWRFPVTLDAAWMFHRQWELQASASLLRLGYDSGFTSVPVYLTVAHYW